MNSVHEIETAVSKLSAEELDVFAVWFASLQPAISQRRRAFATGIHSRRLSREERRVLAIRAAEQSAASYAGHPEDLLPDLVDDVA